MKVSSSVKAVGIFSASLTTVIVLIGLAAVLSEYRGFIEIKMGIDGSHLKIDGR